MAHQAMTEPKGVICIMTSPTGTVMATAADFDTSYPGGFKLWQAQMDRARTRVKWAVVRAYCSSAIMEAVRSCTMEMIADDLCEKGGHKLTFRSIGYPDDIRKEIER